MTNRVQADIGVMRGAIVVEARDGAIYIKSPYDAGFVAALKSAIPFHERTWVKPHWIVHNKNSQIVQDLIYTFYNRSIEMPTEDQDHNQEPDIQAITLEYIGWCKERPFQDNIPSPSATGLANGNWNIIFPESVLKEFFETLIDGNDKTYYQILLIDPRSSQSDLKRAFRSLSKQWHPDVCKEEGSKEKFQEINEAYQILSDPIKRKKYDALLEMTQESTDNPRPETPLLYNTPFQNYRSPLRCGLVIAEGKWYIGKFIVSKIISWDYITNEAGQEMMSYWDNDTKSVIVKWV